VGDGNVGYGDASWQGKDVPAGFEPGAGTHDRGASAPGKAREAAEGGFLGGGDACPVHNTVQTPFQDVMAQCGICRILCYVSDKFDLFKQIFLPFACDETFQSFHNSSLPIYSCLLQQSLLVPGGGQGT
jgi:hypothetical protein